MRSPVADPDRAHELNIATYSEGNECFKSGRYREALKLFKAALAADPQTATPGTPLAVATTRLPSPPWLLPLIRRQFHSCQQSGIQTFNSTSATRTLTSGIARMR